MLTGDNINVASVIRPPVNRSIFNAKFRIDSSYEETTIKSKLAGELVRFDEIGKLSNALALSTAWTPAAVGEAVHRGRFANLLPNCVTHEDDFLLSAKWIVVFELSMFFSFSLLSIRFGG